MQSGVARVFGKKVRKRRALFICSAVNINLRHFFSLGGKEEAVSSHGKIPYKIKLPRELSHRVHMQVDGVQGKWLRQEFGSAQQGESDGRRGLKSGHTSTSQGSLLAEEEPR